MRVNPSSPLGLTVARSTCSPGTLQQCVAIGTNKRCEGEHEFTQQALLQTGSDSLISAAKFWTTAKKGPRVLARARYLYPG